MAFTSPSGEGFGYVVSAASDLLVKVKVGADGRLSFTGDDNTTRYIDLNDPENPLTSGRNAGKNPQGIVITKDGTRAYINNAGSKNVTVVDLNTDSVIKVVPLRPLPDPGTIEEKLLVGAEIFFSSRGNFDAITGATVSLRNRLSSEGWQSCSSCHPHGLTDGVVWQFGSGPRKSVQLNSTFNPFNPTRQRLLNYSAIFDEVEDFEANIRNVSGPGNLPNTTPPQLDPNHGLLIGDDGNVNTAPGVVNSLAKANADRAQLTVTLPGSTVPVPALTALREWIRLAIPTPNAPIPNYGGAGGEPNSVALGRHLFEQVGCVTCHGGSQWTISFKDFKSPPAASEIFTERTPAPTTGNPVGTQYLNRFLREVSTFNLGVLGGGNEFGRNIGAVEQAAPTVNTNGLIVPGADALGKDYNGDGAGNGFNVPSLLGIHALQPYDHNGAIESTAEVLEDTRHWKTGGGDLTLLGDPANRAALAALVESIDTKTPIFNLPGEPILITKIVPTSSQLSVDWIGGTGPFALQKKQELQEDFFTTVATTAELAATDIVSGRSAFYRVFDLGQAPTVWLNVALSGDAERPNAVDTGARGFGYLRVKGTNLSFTITYEGLSGPALGAAIYGPATSSQSGELLFDLTPFKGGDLSTAGRFVGEVPITAKQKAYILGNRTYVNIYTAANPTGEIRGQAATAVMTVSLSGAGERPTPVSTSANGFGVFTLVGRDLSFNLNYHGLSGPATTAHLHGAATDAGIAAPLIELKNFIVVGSGTAGSIVGTVTPNPSQLAAVVDGQVYANIHTDPYPNGEIRGQLSVEETAVPFSADLSGAGERPNTVDTSATGFVYARLTGNQLQLHGVFRGLSGPATAAHIHGPAPASGTADVLFDLASLTRGTLGREGDFIGTIELSEIWRSILLSGDTYINIHTAANPGGEIRGQLSRILLDTVLTGANERPTPIATTAFGSARVALLGHALSFQIDYSGFSSDAVAAHFHGPAGPEQTAPPLIDLQSYALGGFKRTGFILGTLATQPNELAALVENLVYLNLHTGVNGGGEIRGQVKPIIEVSASPPSP